MRKNSSRMSILRFLLLAAGVFLASNGPMVAGDWDLVVVHSNDLWYQLDEITADDKPCYVELPPLTSSTPKPTEATTTPTTTEKSSTTSTTTATTTSTTTATTNSTTTVPATSPNTTEDPTSPQPQETESSNAINNEDLQLPNSLRKLSVPDASKVIGRDAVQCYGGVSRHQTKVTEFRQSSEASGKIFLHLNSGSMLGGYVWYPILGHLPMTEAINDLKFNAVALGYRDFDEGIYSTVQYLKKLQELKVNVLCANINTAREPSMDGLFKRSMMVTIQDRKIGIIGYIGTDADYMADTGKLTFEDEATAISREAGFLLKEGVSFIIALGSTSLERAKVLIQDAKLSDVDLFVNGGGKSSLLWNRDNKGPLNEPVSGTYPIVSTIQQMTRLLVQTPRYGKYLGKVELTITDDGQIKTYSNDNPVLLGPSVNQEPNLQAKVDNWEREVLTQSNEIIGFTKTPIYSDRKYCWYEECNGASLMADAALWFLTKNESNTQSWANSPAGAVWHGGALSDTDLDIGAGDVTFSDILYMFPYANTIALATMSGAQLKQLFENSVEYYKSQSSPNRGEFLHVSGIRVVYDMSKLPGSRVKSLYIRDTSNTDGGMSLVKDENTYKIGMPSFIARGGARYAFMENIYHVETGFRDEYALKDYIKLMTPLAYGKEGRILFSDGVDADCPKTDVTGTVFLTIFLTLLFAGLVFACYKYLYPKLRDRRGSLLSLVR